YYWSAGSSAMFVKLAASASQPAFAAEADGLRELRRARALRVPEVLATGIAGSTAFLALEWIEPGSADEICERRLGEGLAALAGGTAPRVRLWRGKHP